MINLSTVLIYGGLMGISFALIVISIRYQKNNINIVSESVQLKGTQWWFLLIMLIAILVRSVEFGNIPGGLGQDEARTAIDAKAILEYGIDKFGVKNPAWLSSPLDGQQSVMLAWLQMPFIKAFGYSVFTIRLPMLIVSLVGLIALFFYVRDIKGDQIALIVLGLGAIMPYYIMKSRFALDCDVFAHFVLFGMLFLNKLKKGYIYLSMVFFGLAMYCYGLSFMTIPFLLLFCAILLYWKKVVNLKDILFCVIIYFATSLPEWVTMVINALGLESVTVYGLTCPYCSNSVRTSDLLFMNFSFELLLKNIWFAFKTVFLQGFDSHINQIPYIGPYYIFSTPFLIWGIYKVVVECKRCTKVGGSIRELLLMLYGIAGLCTGVLVQVNSNRIGHIFYPVLVFVGIGISDIVGKMWKCRYYILGVYILGFTAFCVRYFGLYDKEKGFYVDFCNAVASVADKGDGKQYKISVEPRLSEPDQESIIMFYHQITPFEYQGTEDMGDGLSYDEKYIFCFYDYYEHYYDPSIEIGKENVGLGDIWIVSDDCLDYLTSEYVLDVKDYGIWNIVTAVESPLDVG